MHTEQPSAMDSLAATGAQSEETAVQMRATGKRRRAQGGAQQCLLGAERPAKRTARRVKAHVSRLVTPDGVSRLFVKANLPLPPSRELQAVSCVVTRGFTGELLVIDGFSGSFTRWRDNVQNQIAEVWGVPKIFQRLVHGVTDLTYVNEAHLINDIVDGGCLSLTLVVSVRLDFDDRTKRKTAVEALVELVDKGHQPSITAVRGLLKDDEWAVRRTAVEALAKLAPKDDQPTITAVRGLLKDPHWVVRKTAVEALAQLAVKGDEATKFALEGMEKDVCWIVRQSTKHARAQLAESVHQDVITKLGEPA